MRRLLLVWTILFTLQVVWGLRNVSLLVMPPTVIKGEHAALLCLYDLENAPLYSVKWYRGNHEFYRYSPTDTPPNKIFPFEGIDVDLAHSNSTQVTLTNVQFKLSGNISCEVSADSPSFSTAIVSRQLMVVDLPDHGPVIHTEKERYEKGEDLRANCTSPPSRPPATLTFLLNNVPVGKPETQRIPGPDLLQSSSLSLRLTLIPSYFLNGQLNLKCIAIVATVYRETAEVHLGVSPKEPVPERVTSPSIASHTSTASVHLLLVLGAVYSSR